jgi:membrane peptidoglycan carboxypeptidase
MVSKKHKKSFNLDDLEQVDVSRKKELSKDLKKLKSSKPNKQPKNSEKEMASMALTSEKDMETIFALPSESLADSANSVLAHDGYLKDSEVKIVKKGSKIGTGYHSTSMEEEEIVAKKQKFIGRKGATTWSKNVSELKKRFGFSWQRFGRKFLIFGVLVGVFSVISLSSVAAVAIDMWNKTESIEKLEREPAQNSVVYARDGKTKIFEFFDEEKREVIDGGEIPLIMKSAVIALEDENFYENQNKESWQKGIPWTNLGGALAKCLVSGGDECRGASGISQQLIKNMTGDDQQDVDRKVRELFRAIKLNQEKTPDEILVSYLNWVPFGRNAYGVQEASKAYFGKPVNQRDGSGQFTLTPNEACYLSAVINKPGYYQTGISELPKAFERKLEVVEEGPIKTEEGEGVTKEIVSQAALDLENRKDICLQKLRDVELQVYQKDASGEFVLNSEGQPILTPGRVVETDQELEELQNKPVIVTSKQDKASNARKEGKTAFVNSKLDDPFPHFREFMTKEIERVVDKDSLNSNGYEIVTTLDPKKQKEVENIVKSYEDTLKTYGADNAAAVVLDGPTGEILSMVGSYGYDREDIDGKVNIITSPQQPGSSIKPYVYMAAFDNGFNPGNVIVDVQTPWNGGAYIPKNFDGRFRGAVTMERALQGSLNIPAVKALFLVDDRPVWDQQSKMNTFFNFSEELGLRYPCVDGAFNTAFPNNTERCTVSEGISQDMIDKAARSRCGISIALGGCEITAVSHVTALNTILQEGKLRTATPFVSIVDKDGENDIYKEKQESEFQPFPTNNPDTSTDEGKNKVYLSRQMTSVMTNYEARIPEFGSLRSNLELRNYGARVAAKTGTSNGPRDFWTCGGSRYYTVCVWTGKTDNATMARSASSARTAAPLWKSIMEYLHEGKEAKPFSTDGLIPSFVGGGGGKTNPDTGEVEGGTRGSRQLLTPKQNEQKYQKSGKVAINSPEDVEKVVSGDIFSNRSAIIPATYFVNSVDGKLFVEGKTLEANKEEVECNLLIGEFPAEPNWYEPVRKLAERSEEYCTLPDPSDQDQYNDNSIPSITTNITSNSTNVVSEISAQASFSSSSSKSVETIEIIINGASNISANGVNSYSVPVSEGGPYQVVVKVTDNLGIVHTTSVSNVEVVSPANALSIGDISAFSCNSAIRCNFGFNSSKYYSSLQIKIGDQSVNCLVSGSSASCGNITISTPGTYNVKLIIDGKSYSTSENVTI